jgi:hypothetical protein
MNPSQPTRRRAAVLASVTATAAAITRAVLLTGVPGSAAAEHPAITFNTVELPDPPEPTFVTVPPLTVVPTLLTIPPATFVTLPPGASTTTTAVEATTTSVAPTNEPSDSAPATEPADEAPGAGTTEPRLEISAAASDCNGVVHVEYSTAALPEPAPAVDHLLVLTSLSDPAAVFAFQLIDQPVNGAFARDLAPPVPGGYRIVVVADFEPDNLAGILLVDEVEAAPASDCPTG